MSRLPEGGSYVEGGKEYVFKECPRCGGKKFYWNISLQVGNCFSGSCELKVGSMEYLHKGLGEPGWEGGLPILPNERFLDGLHEIGAWDTLAMYIQPPTKRLDPWVPADLVPVSQDLAGRMYLAKKNLDPLVALECGVQASPSETHVYAPLVTPDDSLPRGWMKRCVLDGSTYKWIFVGDKQHQDDKGFKSYYFFCHPRFWRNPRRDWIVLVEGVGDLLRQPVVAQNGLAVCGSTLNPVVAAWIGEHVERGVIVWGDYDKAGDEFYERAREAISGWGVGRNCIKRYKYGNPGDDPGSVRPHFHVEELLAKRS